VTLIGGCVVTQSLPCPTGYQFLIVMSRESDIPFSAIGAGS